MLTGKYGVNSSETPTGARKVDPRFSKDNLQKIEPIVSLLRTVGGNYGKTPAQVALNWLICQGNVIPIAGAKTAEQVVQNAGALGWRLSSDEVAELDRITLQWK